MGRKSRGPKKGFKYVRVDDKTIIEVPIDKPDDQAVKDYIERTSESRPKYLLRRKKPDGS
jgi:hypothetical protein